jgi:pimeloyl-ACP methyl ester carboxylesterase
VPVALHVEDDGSGLPLVLLHAFPLSSAMWDDVRRPLAARCRVLTPDQRGFGRSPLGPDAPDLDRCADDVVALLDRLALDRVVLGGLSMGGYVAMALGRRHPERVRALVLADTKATADPEPARASRLRMADDLEARGSDVLVEQVLPALLGTTTTSTRPQVVARVRAAVQDAPAATAAWAQRAMAGRPEAFDVLRGLDVPALVVVGDQDVLSPPDDAQAMADALPQGRLVVLEGAGHLTAVEVPGAFAAAVEAFVQEL